MRPREEGRFDRGVEVIEKDTQRVAVANDRCVGHDWEDHHGEVAIERDAPLKGRRCPGRLSPRRRSTTARTYRGSRSSSATYA